MIASETFEAPLVLLRSRLCYTDHKASHGIRAHLVTLRAPQHAERAASGQAALPVHYSPEPAVSGHGCTLLLGLCSSRQLTISVVQVFPGLLTISPPAGKELTNGTLAHSLQSTPTRRSSAPTNHSSCSCGCHWLCCPQQLGTLCARQPTGMYDMLHAVPPELAGHRT